LVFLSTFFLSSIAGFCQDKKAIEKDLVDCFVKRAQYNDSIDPNTAPAPADTACTNKLLYYTSKFPATLAMDFPSLRAQDVNILTSDDSIFRIYVWHEWLGIKNVSYKSVFQYKVKEKTKSCLLPHSDTSLTGASQAFYDAIYTVKPDSDKTYYLVTYLNKYAPNLREEGVKVFSIEKGKLNDTVHLFKTKTGLHNELSYKYNVMATGEAASNNGIVFDTAKISIDIPVVEDAGKMTEKHITYKFNGQYFERPVAKKEK
jgi:hypothetical protein